MDILTTFILSLYVITFHLSAALGDDNPVVTIKNGPIMGRKSSTVGAGKTYYAFQGIPYAEPPLGNLRFSAPVKKSNWADTLNATLDQSKCIQGSPVEGSEDCLFISVYTPSLSASNLNVMVWIYGGAFISGDSLYETQPPDYLLEEDVIFVQFNYRLGVFGFLSTGDEVCSGNWGLKDQVLALQWVQENIAFFGGNPESVTVFGESAGAASISYLLQTEKTKGLFKAAIMQSGTSLNLWALSRKAKDASVGTAVSLGILPITSKWIVKGLRSVSASDLHEAANTVATSLVASNALAGLVFAPVIEPVHDGALFVSYSHELLSQGGFHRIPTIIGFNSNEAAALGSVALLLRAYLVSYDIQVKNVAPVDLTAKDIARQIAANKIKQHYFGVIPIAANIVAAVNFLSDDQFNRPIDQVVKLQSQYAPVYFYMFSYEGSLGGVETREFQGVGHAEDVGYLFNTSSNASEADSLTRSRMIKFWTNFAKYDNPTPSEDSLLQNVAWRIAGTDSKHVKYLNIDNDLELKQNPFAESIEFYDSIYREYGNPPYNTY